MDENKPVLQLRIVVEAEDFDGAVPLYRDVLGPPERIAYAQGADDRVSMAGPRWRSPPPATGRSSTRSRPAVGRASASSSPSRSPTPRG